MSKKIMDIISNNHKEIRKQIYLYVDGKRTKCFIEYKAKNAYTYAESSRRDQLRKHTKSDRK